MSESVTLAILPAARADRRLRLTLSTEPGAAGLRLTDETFSSDVGWFAQSHIDLTPEQVHELRSVLGVHQPAKASAFSRPREAASRLPKTNSAHLTVHRAG